uniref:Uncharacterized protein n=1 Tax=Lygus hesperus TaxID=30085 RepID=A0A146L3V2_LYGHE
MGTMPDMESEVIVAVGVPSNGNEQSVTKYATSLVVREVYDKALWTKALGSRADKSGNRFYFQSLSSTSTSHLTSTSNANASVLTNGYEEDQSCAFNPFSHFGPAAFYRPYSSTGLIGFTLRTSPAKVEEEMAMAISAFPSSSSVLSAEKGIIAHAQRAAALRFVHSHTELLRDYCDFLATSKFTV